MSRIDAKLLDAYQATSYVVLEGKRSATARVMALNGEIDALLEKRGSAEIVFVTAWNPKSKPASAEANEKATAKLQDILEEEELDYLPAEFRPASKDWPVEKGFAIFDLAPFDALQLAEMLGQYAIVWQGQGQPAHLMFTTLAV
ncbi:DUF3293 domain-containing protein [Niveispirillum sp. BGYR6]|uniref:DUF3293 domain-containing protein n=1 Tax=Niveispirillum sp. BGYR6 TaxID=2971249 RepID=UPI0022B9736D|nr:DUF3293 domain-containing protein [Niveispirillum sp. BGYR6]MDG5494226.1 DUF3293 domain-containing protein [Niveispirillum sp. BGYR6]